MKRETLKQLRGHILTLQELRAADAEKVKLMKAELVSYKESMQQMRDSAQFKALEAIAHAVEAAAKTVMSINRDL